MKRGTAIILGVLILLGATACDQSIEDVKREAEFAKTCKESGGKVFYSGLSGSIQCSFRESK